MRDPDEAGKFPHEMPGIDLAGRPFDYLTEANRIGFVVHFLMDLRAAEILEVVNRAETIAPFVDPTGYIMGAGNLRDMENVVGVLREAQLKLKPILDAMRIRAIAAGEIKE